MSVGRHLVSHKWFSSPDAEALGAAASPGASDRLTWGSDASEGPVTLHCCPSSPQELLMVFLGHAWVLGRILFSCSCRALHFDPTPSLSLPAPCSSLVRAATSSSWVLESRPWPWLWLCGGQRVHVALTESCGTDCSCQGAFLPCPGKELSANAALGTFSLDVQSDPGLTHPFQQFFSSHNELPNFSIF